MRAAFAPAPDTCPSRARTAATSQGGFGSLLRGAGKGGRITENNDACRDLSGRRLRVTNAETKMQEWQARDAACDGACGEKQRAHAAQP